MFIKDFLSTLSERGKLFVLVILISTITILLSTIFGGLWATYIIIIPAIVSILQVTKGIWTPEGGSKSKIGLASLGVALLVIISNPLWKPFLNSLLDPLYNEFPSLKDKLPTEAPSITALVFLAFVILIVNFFARDKTAMKEHSTPIEKEFPEKDYKNLLISFSGTLRDDLNKIDRETNWSSEIFTPLDAEVEIKSGSKRLKKVTDLITAIRSDRKSRVFLVLGVPGSGKSVALRKLCRDLLEEVKQTGKVPLYVNLREWSPKEPWTEEKPPTVEDLFDFVYENLKGRGDVFTNQFLDKYFEKMFENGRLFIVLDSFDEIPSVMDVDENSWLIDDLSYIIYRFLGGGHESRGILASRIFRKPTDKFDAKTIFEIRPFTENKIVEALKKSLYYDELLVTQLFNQRQELIPVARNPFTAALISSYANDNNNTLPQNQSELYSSYIDRRLDACADKIKRKNLTKEKVINGSIEIADVMLTTQEFGLEASISDLKYKIPHKSIEEIIEILRYARLGRLGGGDEQRFSFVHRRFNEYFVVQKLVNQPERVPQEAIPTDSRWRDALVLYCEVASEEEARKIAEFCWSEVKKLTEEEVDLKDPQYIRSIHCLRFLKEAFRARLDCISSFREDLAEFVLNQIEEKENLLSIKLAVEAVGLLEEKDIDAALIRALEINNQWINETALKSCHYLPSLSKELNYRLRAFIETLEMFDFFKRRKEIIFSLKLSNIFKDLKQYCTWRIIDFYSLIITLLAISIFFPLSGLLILVVLSILFYFKVSIDDFIDFSIKDKVQGPSRFTIFIFLMFILLLSHDIARQFTFSYYSSTFYYSDSIHLIFLFFAVPWYQIFYYALPKIFQINIKEILGIFITLLIFALGFGIVIIVINLLGDTFLSILGIIVTLCFGSLVFFRFIKYIINRWYDFNALKESRKKPNLSREQISEHFAKFKMLGTRLQYVQHLQNQDVKPTGTWINGKIPNYNNDEASSLLAQLEEKWLGLDR